jgi:hypothetical protein
VRALDATIAISRDLTEQPPAPFVVIAPSVSADRVLVAVDEWNVDAHTFTGYGVVADEGKGTRREPVCCFPAASGWEVYARSNLSLITLADYVRRRFDVERGTAAMLASSVVTPAVAPPPVSFTPPTAVERPKPAEAPPDATAPVDDCREGLHVGQAARKE